MVNVLIVGTGDHAYGLCHLFHNYNTSSSGNALEVSKPRVEERDSFHDTEVPVVNLESGLSRADIVILVIPAICLEAFVNRYLKQLRRKVLVDVTNSSVPGQDLHSIVDGSSLRWVRAFNDVGAVDILVNKPHGKNKVKSIMCSSSPIAVERVKSFAETSLGMDIKVVPVERYDDVVMQQDSYGEEWVRAASILLAIFVLAQIYAIVVFHVNEGLAWYHISLHVANKAIAWTSLWGFTLCLLPGLLGRLSNYVFTSSLHNKPRFLRKFLATRKHLGVLSLWFLSIHLVMSIILFNPAYYGRFYVDDDDADACSETCKMNARGEAAMLFGTLGTGLYAILGVCSLPSVGSNMTKKQWELAFGPVAWIALAFGTGKVLIAGMPGWYPSSEWPGGMPPINLIAPIFPLFVMALKVAQAMLTLRRWPCLHATAAEAETLPVTTTCELKDEGTQEYVSWMSHDSGTTLEAILLRLEESSVTFDC